MNDAGSFYSDLEFPDQYYGVLIRSTVQRGRLVDIRPPQMPDGYHLYTAVDVPGENRISAMGTVVPVFTPFEILYYGEPLGILVGPDLQTVTDLVSEVLIETEALEPWTFGERFSSAQVVGKRVIESGDPDGPLSNPDLTHETLCELGPQDHYYTEPLGAAVNIANGALEIHSPTQWPFHVRDSVSAVLDLDPSDIVVHQTNPGAHLDGKIWFPSLIACQAALAAVLCKHPVRVCFSRQEDFLFSPKSVPVTVRYATVAGEDGSIEALSVRILINAGAYSPLIDEVIDRVTLAALGFYRVKNWRIETWGLRTNMPPMGVLSGWGESLALFALENHLASVIRSGNHSPMEWKLFHVLGTKDESMRNFGFPVADSITELFSQICTMSDFPRKYTAYEHLARLRTNRNDGPLRGIGIVCGYQGNGFISKTMERAPYAMEVTMETDGSVTVKTGMASVSMRDAFAATAAEIFGIKPELVRFTERATDKMSPAGPETLSAAVTILAPLFDKCCRTIQRQRFREPLPITAKKTWRPSKNDAWSSVDFAGKPFVSTTPGACAIEVELDPVTYEPSIRGVWIACDAGRLFSKRRARSELVRNAHISLSRVLCERIAIRDGRFAPTDSVQYDMLTPDRMADVEVTFIDSKEESKGIGTLAQNLIPAAYAAALAQIIRQPVGRLPLDPAYIHNLLESRGESKEETVSETEGDAP